MLGLVAVTKKASPNWYIVDEETSSEEFVVDFR